MTTEATTVAGGKLAAALAKAQAKFEAATKNRTNPHFGSKYADLAAIISAVSPALSENGLAVSQDLSANAEGVTCRTVLMHVSGESIEGRLWLPVTQKTPQGYGSAATYARRYGLSALVGIASEEDDDGNAASVVSDRATTIRPPPMKQNAPVPRRDEPPPPMDEHEAPAAPTGGGDPTGGATFPFGKSKGQAIHGAPIATLEWFANAARRELADNSKAKFHEKTRAQLHVYESELARQRNGAGA